MERNVSSLSQMRAEFESSKSLQDRIADAFTRFAGSMAFVYLHALVIGAWIFCNLRVLPLRPWDPFPFVMLAMIASVEAIFLSTFVLISQNRMSALDDRRADLNVQVSLLTEHELTRLLDLVNAIAKRLDIEPDAGIDDLRSDVAPEEVLRKIEEERASR